MTDMAPTCRCSHDEIGHVHTREPRPTQPPDEEIDECPPNQP